MTAPPEIASWDLVAAAQAGDRDAFGQLWSRYRRVVASNIRSYIRDRGAVEDLTAETFLKAWYRIGTFQDQGKDVAAWLTRIGQNLAIDFIRMSARRATFPSGCLGDADDGWLPPVQGSDVVVDDINRRDAYGLLEDLIAGLSPQRAAVLRCRFYRGMSITETASYLGMSEMAVKSAQSGAVHTIRVRSKTFSFDEFFHSAPARPV